MSLLYGIVINLASPSDSCLSLLLPPPVGNKPPWTLPAKARYLTHDARRSCERAGKPEITPPKDLMAMAMTVLVSPGPGTYTLTGTM